MAELSSIFMDASEKEASIVGEGFLYKFLESGVLKDRFCVLTDKRLYVRGWYLHNTDGAYRIRKGEYTIDVDKIICSGFSTARFGGLFILELLLAIFLCVSAGFFLHFVEIVDNVYFGTDSIIWACSILLAISFVAVPIYFYVCPQKIFVIEYGGGRIAFLSYEYLDDDFRRFQRDLYRVKDAFTSAARCQEMHLVPAAPEETEEKKEGEEENMEKNKNIA